MSNLLNDQLVDMEFICVFTGLSNKCFYKLISQGKFSNPIKLGRSSRWLKIEVQAWLEVQINASH